MVLEMADILIKPGQNADFEAAMEQGLRTVHTRAKGMRGYRLQRCIENADRYVLQVYWDSVDDHMVGYRQNLSPEFRALVMHYFAQPTSMHHFEEVVRSDALPPL
jgi:heme-degrading monooxygenase HmoA